MYLLASVQILQLSGKRIFAHSLAVANTCTDSDNFEKDE